jgi:hypothetical protein
MVTGALASSYYGRPRTALDIYVVMSVRRKGLPMLANALDKSNLDVQEERVLTSWQSNSPIATLEDGKSPHTLDIVFTNRKLERRGGHILGVPTHYQSAESLILKIGND